MQKAAARLGGLSRSSPWDNFALTGRLEFEADGGIAFLICAEFIIFTGKHCVEHDADDGGYGDTRQADGYAANGES